MRPLALAIFGMLLLSEYAVAQTQENSWENLRALSVGSKIQVVDQNLKSQDGTFTSVSDDALIFQVRDQQVVIQRASVLRVSSREHLGRGQKALIGLGIGALVGAVTGAAIVIGAGENDFVGPGGGAILLAVPFGLIGAGIGAGLPAGHPTIYRAEPQASPNP